MGASCCDHDHRPPVSRDDGFRGALWIALVVNLAMFLVEVASGLFGGSVSLQADALDFLGDAANYGISLAVLGLTLAQRAKAALLKGLSMGVFGLWVVGSTIYNSLVDTVPSPAVMGVVGLLALAANLGVAVLLYRHRNGDSNRRSVWLCTRNDAIGNLAVIVAATGVFASGTAWPDLAVAVIMAGLALSACYRVITHAVSEIRAAPRLSPAE